MRDSGLWRVERGTGKRLEPLGGRKGRNRSKIARPVRDYGESTLSSNGMEYSVSSVKSHGAPKREKVE